jgi:predicted transcriptional regulator
MSATEIIEQFKALPASERAQVAKFVVENDDSWIPECFKQGMADAEAGRFVDLDTALNEPYPVINEIRFRATRAFWRSS